MWTVRKRQPIWFYRDVDGDYLCVNRGIYHFTKNDKVFEGRATAIKNNRCSMCTTSISQGYLRECCVRVNRSEVPNDWFHSIGY
jgi:hypothetical protein